MNSFIELLYRATMGCVCAREIIDLNNRRFYVRTRLGEGGFSYVDLVEDSRTHKQYALKRIACHSREDEVIAMREVECMRKFKHKNLVPLEEAASVPVRDPSRSVVCEVMIVMPFHRRGTLWDELEFCATKSENIQEIRILNLFRGICEGLQVLHTAKPEPLAHRDVKPQNVLLAEDDTPVLMDFGSMAEARIEIKGTSQAMAVQDAAAERCSMPYRAPELFNVESYGSIDERVDIWSLGCTLYAMCYHESPFDKAYQRGDSIALAVLGGNIKFPENDTYSADIRDLILSMLVINAVERPYVDLILNRIDTMINRQENRI